MKYPRLYKALRKFGHPPIEWMPKDYQPESMGGGGREWHDDWGIMLKNKDGGLRKKPVWWQPWQYIKRIDNAYAVPLPFKKIEGNGQPQWMPLQHDHYPLAPGAETMKKSFNFGDGLGDRVVTWVKTMMSIHPAGQWSRQKAYINGEWIECWYTRSWNFFGSRITYYGGLKLDQDGPMCWFPEFSGSIKWGRLK